MIRGKLSRRFARVDTMTETARPHLAFVADIVDLVRRHGAAAALATLRDERPAVTAEGYHDTRAVFAVWAVDRLLAAEVSPRLVLWHPLLHADSVLVWWTREVLDSAAAAERFVPADRVLPGEPVPHEPLEDLVAA
jgi:hypothetical protein